MSFMNRKSWLVLGILAIAVLLGFQNCVEPKKGSSDNPGTMCLAIAPLCAAPPVNCHYGTPSIDEGGCASGCGPLICDSTPPSCPLPQCAPVGENCHYDGPPTLDGSGCPINCGSILVCNSNPAPLCTPPSCPAPPVGCVYQGPADQDPVTNCPINCGHLVCTTCSAPPSFAPPPPGSGHCALVVTGYDVSGCPSGWKMECESPAPPIVPPPSPQ